MKSPYRQALDYLYSFTDYGKLSGYTYSADRFDLARVVKLLSLLGDPQRSFRAVHVAGTKGKGSTSAMIASILRQAGYRTALYTSPHLHTFRERIQIDGNLASRQAVVDGVDRLRAVAPQVPAITTFELITALALDRFARGGAEWAVLEVGMGGRLDATNVVTPEVAVITPISYDHMIYLGDTLADIATEKAGIIKPGVPVVCAPQPPEAGEVISCLAREKNAPLTIVGRDWQWQHLEASTQEQQFSAWSARDRWTKATYTLPLLGRHQQVNATTALAALAQLSEIVSPQAARAGLASVRWPGRLEVLQHRSGPGEAKRPWVIVDGAHNGDSMQKLRATLDELFPYKEMTLILGISADKDLDRILDAILPSASRVLVTQAHHPRAADAEQLAAEIKRRGQLDGIQRSVQVAPIESVLPTALSAAGENDLVCVTGSLFVVAECRASWFEYKRQPLPPSDTE